MNPKENHENKYYPSTPVKVRPTFSQPEELRLIDSAEKPEKQDLFDSIIQKKQYPLFISNQKEDNSINQESSRQQHSLDSQSNSSDEHDQQEENLQTVKKVFESKLATIDTKIGTAGKNNTKGCNCDKSKCLKNYCVCYKSGNTCSEDCQCIDCQNIKITSQHLKNQKIALEFLSNSKFKGCNCKNSGCLKKYCICHQHGRKCSDLCRCQNCHNTEGNGKHDFEDEKGVRLVFTARKKIKVSEYQGEDSFSHIGMGG